MFTIAIAGARDRLTITAVETFERVDPGPLRVVTLLVRLPERATPDRQHATVSDVARTVREQNAGADPRIVVSYGGAGTTLTQLLREDYRRGRREHWPYPITTVGAAADGIARYVSPSDLAAQLYVEWSSHRIAFAPDAPGIDKLRAQVAAFAPVETRAGSLRFGGDDDGLAEYEDAVVSLMHAVAVRRGFGVARFMDASGRIWPSRIVARGHIGSAASAGPTRAVTTLGSGPR